MWRCGWHVWWWWWWWCWVVSQRSVVSASRPVPSPPQVPSIPQLSRKTTRILRSAQVQFLFSWTSDTVTRFNYRHQWNNSDQVWEHCQRGNRTLQRPDNFPRRGVIEEKKKTWLDMATDINKATVNVPQGAVMKHHCDNQEPWLLWVTGLEYYSSHWLCCCWILWMIELL